MPRTQAAQSVTVKRSVRLNIFLNTVYFVLGFSLVFAVLGVILNSFLTNVGTGFQSTFQSIGGVVIIGFGAYLILSTKLRLLNFEKRMTKLPRFKTTYITSFVFGAAFASGWTPCVGPILGHDAYAGRNVSGVRHTIRFLHTRSASAIPFLITGAFFSQATKVIRKMVKHLKYFNPIMGAVLIILGILVFTNQLSIIGNFPACQRNNQSGEGHLNKDNLSALAVGIGVVALIAGFGIYFNSPD